VIFDCLTDTMDDGDPPEDSSDNESLQMEATAESHLPPVLHLGAGHIQVDVEGFSGSDCSPPRKILVYQYKITI